ncbi:MAG: ribonuclease III [Clostridiales bacterium]|nr:ribonuclease III [Clostridiales bacterium]
MFLKDETENTQQPRLYSPLTLAFLGDAVYSLLVREALVRQANRPAGELHKRSVRFVSAAAQAAAVRGILPILSEEETAILKRGRNAHSSHTPKNQSESDYRYATGFEALMGYLYLKGDTDRLEELFGIVFGGIQNHEKEKNSEK